MTFISTDQLLASTFEKRKKDRVKVFPSPVSEICKHCWYQALCVFRVMSRQPPHSCCVYELFGERGVSDASLEEVVEFTCNIRCKDRQKWVGDSCPHNENYCTNHCPVSRYILGKEASNIGDVPYEEYG